MLRLLPLGGLNLVLVLCLVLELRCWEIERVACDLREHDVTPGSRRALRQLLGNKVL